MANYSGDGYCSSCKYYEEGWCRWGGWYTEKNSNDYCDYYENNGYGSDSETAFPICYLEEATELYTGIRNSVELDTIRMFRDKILRNSRIGREVISLYYKWSKKAFRRMSNMGLTRRKRHSKVWCKFLIPGIAKYSLFRMNFYRKYKEAVVPVN